MGSLLLMPTNICKKSLPLLQTATYYLNVSAIAKDLAPDDLVRLRELKHYAKGCVQPAIKYFLKRFSHVDGDLYHIVRAFKAARPCCHRYVKEAKPAPEAVDQLRVFPIFDDDEMT